MAFRRLDTRAVADDSALSAALLQDLDAGARAAIDEKHRRATWALDARNAPRLCGLDEVGVPLLWRLRRRASGLRVRVFGLVQEADVTFHLRVRAASDTLTPLVELPASSVTLSPSVSAQVAVLELSAAQLARWTNQAENAARELVLILSARSAQGTAVRLVAKGTLNYDGHLASWDRFSLIFAAENNALAVNGVPQAAIEIRRYDTAGAAYVSPSSDVPSIAQVLRVWNDPGNSRYRVFTYPPPGSSGSALNTGFSTYRDEAWWVPLGYMALYSITVEETGSEQLPALGWSLNAGQPPVAQDTRRIYARAKEAWTAGLVYRLGTCQALEDATQQDTATPAAATVGTWFQGSVGPTPNNAPADQLTYTLDTQTCSYAAEGDAGTWAEAAWSQVAGWSRFEDAMGSSLEDRMGVEALVYLVAHGYNAEARLGWRARLVSRNGSPDVEGDTEAGEVALSAFWMADPLRDLAGYLLGFWDFDYVESIERSGTVLTALRGFYPIKLWHRFGFTFARLGVLLGNADEQHVALELQASEFPLDGGISATRTNRRLQAAAWTVLEMESSDPQVMGL